MTTDDGRSKGDEEGDEDDHDKDRYERVYCTTVRARKGENGGRAYGKGLRMPEGFDKAMEKGRYQMGWARSG
jgi:hypothetical protein